MEFLKNQSFCCLARIKRGVYGTLVCLANGKPKKASFGKFAGNLAMHIPSVDVIANQSSQFVYDVCNLATRFHFIFCSFHRTIGLEMDCEQETIIS